ncbi:Acetylcholinesterase [Leucoagaricus sp. SymC.cos]|nr:Acetylcholinesterase [Leucoagaricus sp. SymC.cos]
MINSNQRRAAVPDFSEDCLFLNVFTPNPNANDLPVVVWIHGGGYALGSATGFEGFDIYDGNDLIRAAGGRIVAVTIQYRLGALGFLAGQKVHDEGALNAGLLDQQFAFQWVQRHIHKFGGNPHQVTIWGQSAGAGSVLLHIVANGGNTQPPLFRAAMTSSASLSSLFRYNDRIPEQIYATFVNATGCSPAKDSLQCLRNADIKDIQQANIKLGVSAFFGIFTFIPVIDGRLFEKRPTQLLREGKLNGEALLSFTNSNEGFLFVDQNDTAVQVPQYIANLYPTFHDRQITAATAQYKDLGAPLSQVTAIVSESIFLCPAYFLLRAFKNKGFEAELAVPPANHGDDLGYYFPGPINRPTLNDTRFIDNFAQSFMNFVMTMDPNKKWDSGNTVPHWDRWSKNGRLEMVFNRTEAGEPVIRSTRTNGDLLERCNFWESVSQFSAQ